MRNVVTRIPETLQSIRILSRAGLVPFPRLDEGLRSLRTVKQIGPIAGPVRMSARRDPRKVGIVDELGPLTYSQLESRSNALARAWAQRGLGEGSVIGVLCRDHRGLIDSMVASGKLGSRLLLLNTGFAKPQFADVVKRENVSALVYDEEFAPLLDAVEPAIPRFLAWTDTPAGESATTLEELIVNTDDRPLPNPGKPGGFVLLTSGTTGTPKGAPRQVKSGLSAAQLLDRIPMRVNECTVIAAPLFHGTALSQFIISFALGCTVVVRRKFDPEATLKMIQDNKATELVVVPVMLQRILDLGEDVVGSYDTSSLRIVFSAGSALSPELGNRATKAFGDVVYNLYGSTEVAVATVATPEDWRAAPGTVGKVPCGCRVNLYDDHGARITEPDVIGRIFVGSDLAFGGYTDGRNKEVIDGLLSSGDVGHFDAEGRLFIDGRDDDMIVSGGENVYPVEVENLLAEHPGVVEAAVIGVTDPEFGQRLRAFVVRRDGIDLDEDGVKAHVKANLARYKVPRDVQFLESLPRNPTGKLLRGKLSEMA
ncbi:acyl-CoA synthetase [Kibdelosporangium phytohabitans]|uniref:Acyl-CoA synthetase n=1 Tax=Kibdelosporangium phytohabitans TaxID=860235 RepID=A0A0N9HYT1_9PSEU|nr:acyl-CoA synthetase [Kibdelosporangium phytohabitans]ALG07318.1 acyl-CoA synthetase [Kibdelosporangium phytohabitans]MBE1471815.1 fatty-acyl-CoA synthase [Kibdelosporangium phytohabitans]